jgi:predicted DNA-binding transcriptional regulator AlpA
MQSRFSPKTLYKWINMGEIARHENVHHPGRKIVIHGPRSKRWSCGEVDAWQGLKATTEGCS